MNRQMFPNCCAVDIISGFGYDGQQFPPEDVWENKRSVVAIFKEHQKGGYDLLCKHYKLLSVTKIPGAHGNYKLALCVFQRK